LDFFRIEIEEVLSSLAIISMERLEVGLVPEQEGVGAAIVAQVVFDWRVQIAAEQSDVVVADDFTF
jgi:hypothetical protein